MKNQIRWWWVGLFNPFIRIMNLTDKLTTKEMLECADWMKAEAENRSPTEGEKA